MTANFLFIATVLLGFHIGVDAARAADPVRIISGGPSSAKLLSTHKAEIEKAAGVSVEIRTAAANANFKNLATGHVDAIIIGDSPESAFKKTDAKDLAGEKLENFEWCELNQIVMRMALNPENTTQELSKDKLADLLRGKIKNWKDVGGPDAPVKPFFIKASAAAFRDVSEYYLAGQSPTAFEYVNDNDGLVRAIQHNKGAIAFAPFKQSIGGFTPRYINTEIKHPTYYVTAKKAATGARAAFEYIKTMPKELVD